RRSTTSRSSSSSSDASRPIAHAHARSGTAHAVVVLCAWAIYLGNIGWIAYFWVDNGNLLMHTTADLLARSAGLAGLIGAYLALVQVVLLARLPVLERLAGFDRL